MNQLQTQLVSEALNQMEDVMDQTIKEKCANLDKLIKSKSYEVSQMQDECRRMWLLCLIRECNVLNKACIKFGLANMHASHSIVKDVSYDKQITWCCMLIGKRMNVICQKVSTYNGKFKKMWMDDLEEMCEKMESWSPDQNNSESESEWDE